MSNNLHPSVREFKAFLQKNPKLVKEVRKNGQSLQTYYEKWALLGEDDPFWDQFKERTDGKQSARTKQGKAEWMDKLIQMSEKVDMDKVQSQVQNLNETISTVQGLLSQFQPSENESQQQPTNNQDPSSNQNLFSIFKD
ncbi:YlbD family protein [Barrientosiimonas marina]|uniref:YlbD family protein n=1 Tax=Lentibacillus kimchii TaxID=1542911 RepID=A0ABW2UPL6_9BACI